MLTKEQILGARDLQTQVVPVAEWGGDVRVSVMGGAAREAFLGKVTGPMPNSEFFALVLVSTLVDDDGNLLFSQDEIVALQQKNPDVMARLAGIAIQFNKLSASAVEEAEKNSEASQSDDSGTDLPSRLE